MVGLGPVIPSTHPEPQFWARCPPREFSGHHQRFPHEQSQSVWPLRSLRQKAVLGLLVTWARSYADQAGTVGDVGWALVQETEGLRPPRSRVRVVRASWLST